MAINKINSKSIEDLQISADDLANSTVTRAKLSYPLTTFSSTGIDDNATSTSITLDSSGTVFVGKTVTNVDTDGVSLGTGVSTFSASNDRVLTINRNGTDGSLIEFYNDGISSLNLRTISNGLEFSSGSTPYLNILSGGNIGINQNNPAQKLDVLGNIRANNVINRSAVVGVDATPSDENSYELGAGYLNLSRDDTNEVNQIQFGKNGTLAAAFSTGSNYLAIKTNGDNERMRIDSGGNVVIGSTTAVEKLTLYGKTWLDTRVSIGYASNSNSGSYLLGVSNYGAVDNGAMLNFRICTTGNQGGHVIRIKYKTRSGDAESAESNGAYCNGTTWVNASDQSMKTNITDIGYGLDTIKTLQPREFEWSGRGLKDIGFVAQELQTKIPEVVSGEDGSKGVNYGALTAVLVKGMQEQQTIIEELKARITALENA